MPARRSISQAGEHSSLANTDRIPASKGPFTPGIGGYHQISSIQASTLNALAVVPSTPARSLNTSFRPSTTKHTLVSYSVRITCTATLAGGQDGKIELMSDATDPPTTIRATAQNRNSVSLAIALTAVNEQTTQLSYLVPAGHYVRLLSTQTTGTPTFSIISQTEEALP